MCLGFSYLSMVIGIIVDKGLLGIIGLRWEG